MPAKTKTYWDDDAVMKHPDQDAAGVEDRRGRCAIYVTAASKDDAVAQLAEAGYPGYRPADLKVCPTDYQPHRPLFDAGYDGVPLLAENHVVIVSKEFRRPVVLRLSLKPAGQADRTVIGVLQPRTGYEIAPIRG